MEIIELRWEPHKKLEFHDQNLFFANLTREFKSLFDASLTEEECYERYYAYSNYV